MMSTLTGILSQRTPTSLHNDCILAGLLVCIHYHNL